MYLSFFLLKIVYCNHVLDKKKHEDGNKQALRDYHHVLASFIGGTPSGSCFH